MQHLLAYIDDRTRELHLHPFITWLSDTSVPPHERLSAWLPCAAFFVFGFKDINAEALRYPEEEARQDPLKDAINRHGKEDSMHWPWYLSDLRTLGLDKTTTLSEALRFLWSTETTAQRRAVYQLHTLIHQAREPILRYALIAALESYAHLLFATITQVSAEYQQQTGIRLKYLGPLHLDQEPGHMLNQDDSTEQLILNQSLDTDTRKQAIEIGGAVCDVINARWQEFYAFAKNGSRDASMAGGR